MGESRDELLRQIVAEEVRLAAAGRQQREARTRLVGLRGKLAAMSGASVTRLPLVNAGLVPSTPSDKVKLFHSLFRGRADVFPTRFVSRKTSKAGYVPACSNKFRRGLCELPKIKCGECGHQAFLPCDDQAILDHLRGRHVMGVYPLLEDDTCWFLAADFDKDSWREDITAFIETCGALGVPVAVERSRSGAGAHAWFFFTEPVVAADARKMGCYLITEAMARRHQLSMGSYDRLFPNQDTGGPPFDVPRS